MRVLCVHGHATSGHIFEKQLRPLLRQLPKEPGAAVELRFVDGVHEAAAVDSLSGLFRPPFYSWYDFADDWETAEAFHCEGADESVAFLADVVRREGPFDGVLGFSQGSTLATTLVAMGEAGELPRFRFAVFLCGLPMGDARFRRSEALPPLSTPSLHLVGAADRLARFSRALAELYSGAEVLEHPEGHVPVPRRGGVAERVAAFVASGGGQGFGGGGQGFGGAAGGTAAGSAGAEAGSDEAPGSVEDAAEAPDSTEDAAETPGSAEVAAEAPGSAADVNEVPGSTEDAAEAPGSAEDATKAPGSAEDADEAPGTVAPGSSGIETPASTSSGVSETKDDYETPGSTGTVAQLPTPGVSETKETKGTGSGVSETKDDYETPGVSQTNQTPHTNQQQSDLSGFLNSRGSWIWTRRWFSLDAAAGRIHQRKGTTVKAPIELDEGTSVYASQRRPHAFVVNTAARWFLLQAPDRATRDLWIDRVRAAVWQRQRGEVREAVQGVAAEAGASGRFDADPAALADAQREAAYVDLPVDALDDDEREPLAALLSRAFAKHAERPCLGRMVDGGAACDFATYGEVWAAALALGAALRRLLRGRDDPDLGAPVVALLGPNSRDWVLCDLACLLFGIVVVPLPASASRERLAALVAHARASVVLADAACAELVEAEGVMVIEMDVLNAEAEPARAQDAPPPGWGDDAEAAPEGRETTAAMFTSDLLLRGQAQPEEPLAARSPQAVVSVVYTSGSQGEPKGVPVTYGRWSEVPLWVNRVSAPRILSFAPLSHIAERDFCRNTLLAGGSVVLLRSAGEELFDAFQVTRPLMFASPPRFLSRIYGEFLEQRAASELDDDAALLLNFRRLLGGRVRHIIVGSAPSDPAVVEWTRRCFQCELHNGYGTTESGPISSSGIVMEGMQVRLVDVPGLGYRTSGSPPRGEVLVRHPLMRAGYLRDPAASASAFRDGWFRTGDVAELQPRGRLVVIDRLHNFFKLAQGVFVAAERLELAFLKSQVVSQVYVHRDSALPFVCAVAVPRRGVLAGLLGLAPDDPAVVDADDAALRVRTALRTLAASLGLKPYEAPQVVVLAAEPFSPENGLLTPAGKLARRALAARYGPAVQARSSPREQARMSVLDVLREFQPGTGEQLQLDSLSAVRLRSRLKEQFGVQLPLKSLVGAEAAVSGVIESVQAAHGLPPEPPPVEAAPVVVAVTEPTVTRGHGLSVDSFERIRVIGQGGLGKVALVRKKADGRLFALKSIHKQRLVESGQVDAIFAERTVLEEVVHPFISRLRYAFQSDSKIYLVTDYCPGGDLALLLRQRGALDAAAARFFAAEVLLALEHLHRLGIIYRDLKPENVLIDAEGHARLTDFGCSKLRVREGRQDAHTFVGSPEYLAPEVIRNQGGPAGYGTTADLWSLGVMLFEMLTGRKLFHDASAARVYDNVLTREIQVPAALPDDAQSLLAGLLDRDPDERLGSAAEGGVAELWRHPFFADVDVGRLGRRELRPPVAVAMDASTDVSAFPQALTSQATRESVAPAAGVDFERFTFSASCR